MAIDDGRIVCAYTSTQHLLVDLDHASTFQATGLAIELIKSFPYLGNCLVVDNRGRSHHLVFDNICDFSLLENIIDILYDFSIVNPEVAYFRSQRGDFSLRVSEKITIDEVRPVPNPAFFIANNRTLKHDGKILDYLALLNHFNPSVSRLLESPLPIFPICRLVSSDLVVYTLRESSLL